jgi:hypothetical protein
MEVRNERQRKFIEELRNASDLGFPADLLEVSPQDLKDAIRDKLKPAAEPSRELPAGDGRQIYLITEMRDEEAVAPLANYLHHQGHSVLLPVFTGDEAEIRADHENTLRTCDAIVLFYGAGGELWLRRKLGEIQRSHGMGRNRPLLSEALYVALPDTPEKRRLRLHEPLVIHQPAEGFSPGLLDPFLAPLERGQVRRMR